MTRKVIWGRDGIGRRGRRMGSKRIDKKDGKFDTIILRIKRYFYIPF